jgi:hypothetical protein
MPHIRTYERSSVYIYVILLAVTAVDWLIGGLMVWRLVLIFVEPLHFLKKGRKLECRQLLNLRYIFSCFLLSKVRRPLIALIAWDDFSSLPFIDKKVVMMARGVFVCVLQ